MSSANANGKSKAPAHVRVLNTLIESKWFTAANGPEVKVWLLLKKLADSTTGECYPGMGFLALKTGFSRASVCRAIQALIDVGLVECLEKGKPPRTSSRYRISDRSTHGTMNVPPVEPYRSISGGSNVPPAQQHRSTSGTNPYPINQLQEQQPPQPQPDGSRGGGGGWLGKKAEAEAIKHHGAEHVARVIRLVELKKSNGSASRPKRLLRHLLNIDPADVDFSELEEHDRLAIALSERAEADRRYQAAREAIAAIPLADRDAWKELLGLRFPGRDCTRANRPGSILFGELVMEIDDVHAALADARLTAGKVCA